MESGWDEMNGRMGECLPALMMASNATDAFSAAMMRQRKRERDQERIAN
jgi:hypothetical protein